MALAALVDEIGPDSAPQRLRTKEKRNTVVVIAQAREVSDIDKSRAAGRGTTNGAAQSRGLGRIMDPAAPEERVARGSDPTPHWRRSTARAKHHDASLVSPS